MGLSVIIFIALNWRNWSVTSLAKAENRWSMYAIASCPDTFLHRLHLDLWHLHKSLHFPIDRLSNISRQFGVALHGLSHRIDHVGDHSTESRTFNRHFHRKWCVELRRFISMDIDKCFRSTKHRRGDLLSSSFTSSTWQRSRHCHSDLRKQRLDRRLKCKDASFSPSRWPLPFPFHCWSSMVVFCVIVVFENNRPAMFCSVMRMPIETKRNTKRCQRRTLKNSGEIASRLFE